MLKVLNLPCTRLLRVTYTIRSQRYPVRETPTAGTVQSAIGLKKQPLQTWTVGMAPLQDTAVFFIDSAAFFLNPERPTFIVGKGC